MENNIMMKKLSCLRKEKGYSQEEVAEKLGVSRQAVSKWERGESSPDTENLIGLAKLYSTSLDELLLDGPLLGENRVSVQKEEIEEERIDNSTDKEGEKSFYQSSKWKELEKEMERKVNKSKVPYPILVNVLYLILGFGWGLWHPGWLIYLTIPLHGLRKNNSSWRAYAASPIMITIIYVLLGHYFGLWHPGWMLFLCIPIFQRYANGNILQ